MTGRPNSRFLPLMGVWAVGWAALGLLIPKIHAFGAAAVAMILWAVWAGMDRRSRRIRPPGVLPWIRSVALRGPTVAAVLAAAACLRGGTAAAPEEPPLDGRIGVPVWVDARIVSVLPREADMERVVVAELTELRTGPDAAPDGRGKGLRVRMRVSSPVAEGDRIAAWVRLRAPPPPPAPFPPHVADPWEQTSLFYRAEPEPGSAVIVQVTWRSLPGRVRAVLERQWTDKADPTAEALLKAMVLGDTADLDPRITDAFALTGVAHVVAVSGAHLHVVLWPLRHWLEGRMAPRKKLWLIGGAAACYAALTGGSPSAARAAAMVWYVETAAVLGRPAHPLNAWGATLAVETLWHPTWVLDLGFQLSYAATWGIFVLEPALRSAPGRGPGWLTGPLAAAGAAEIAICPFTFSNFYVWNGWTLLANLWAPPAGGLLLGWGLLSLMLGDIPGLGAVLMRGADHLALWMVRGVTAMDGDRRWLLRLGPLPVWVWGAYAATLLAAVGLWGRGRRTGVVCVAAFCAVVILSVQTVGEQMVVFSLGGRSAVFVEAGGRRELICPDRADEVKMLVLPYLRRMGVHALDRVWIAPVQDQPAQKAKEEPEPAVPVLTQRMAVRRIERWTPDMLLHLRMGRQWVWVGDWPLQILLPDRLAVDLRKDAPPPGFTGRERRWSTRGQGGLLLDVRRGEPAVYGAGGSVSAPPYGLRLFLPLCGLQARPQGFHQIDDAAPGGTDLNHVIFGYFGRDVLSQGFPVFVVECIGMKRGLQPSDQILGHLEFRRLEFDGAEVWQFGRGSEFIGKM